MSPLCLRAQEAAKSGTLTFKFRHQVSKLITKNGAVTGVKGEVLEASNVKRGEQSSRKVIAEFEYHAQAVIVSSGGIGGNLELVKKNWPTKRLGKAPNNMIAGVPHHVDGKMIAITKRAGANAINEDRMWHYTEGVKNFDPIWPSHGIRIFTWTFFHVV